MARPRKLTDEEIAAAQVMRLAGSPWKTVCTRFNIGRTQLWEAIGGKNVRKLISEHQPDTDAPKIKA